jgi:hypothetical protein
MRSSQNKYHNLFQQLRGTQHLLTVGARLRRAVPSFNNVALRPPLLRQTGKSFVASFWSGRRDLNSGPLAPQASALARLRHGPIASILTHPLRHFACRHEFAGANVITITELDRRSLLEAAQWDHEMRSILRSHFSGSLCPLTRLFEFLLTTSRSL